MPGFDGDDSGGLSPLKPKGKKKAAPKQDPERMLVQAAARLGRVKDPEQRERVMSELGKAFEGMTQVEINRIAGEANLLPDDVLVLTRAAQPRSGPSPVVASALDYLDRPAQAAKGALVELQGDPTRAFTGEALRGAYRGATGKERYAGTTAAIASAGVEKEQAEKIRASLPGPVRFAGDVAVDMTVDPTNWFSFGAGTAAETAARSAAKRVAGDAAEAVTMSARAQGIYDDILRVGKKALTDEQQAALPSSLVKRLNKAQGGIRVAGVKIPRSERLPLVGRKAGVKAGPKKPESFASEVEQVFRPRAAVRATERAGTVPKGTTQTVENLQARLRAARTLADMAERRVQRGAREAAAEAAGVTGRRATGRAGKRALADVDLNPVREALDVRGGQAAREALPAGQREVADRLRALSGDDFARLKATGRLSPEEEALAARRLVASAEFDRSLERAAAQVERAERSRYRQSGRWATVEGRRQVSEAADLARAERAAGVKAVERESVLEARSIAREQRALNAQIRTEATAARQAEREAARTVRTYEASLNAVERELRDVSRQGARAGSAAERRGLRLRSRALQEQREALTETLARAVGDQADATAARSVADRAAADLRVLDPGSAPSSPGRPRPAISRSTANAQSAAAREGTRLRVMENVKRSAETRASRIAAQQRAAVADVRVIPQDRYFPSYPSKEAYDLGVLVPQRPPEGLGGKGPGFLKERKSAGTASDAPPLPSGAPSRELDPIVAMGRHAKETVRDSTRVDVFGDLARAPGPGGKPMLVTDPDVVAAVRAQPGWGNEYKEITVPVTREGADGARRTVDDKVMIRREIADEFDKVMNADIGKIRSAAAYMNALWARYATATTGFISRNVLQGNLYLGMVLAGANDPRVWARSLGTWKRVQQGIVRLGDPYRYLDDAERQLMRGALENNAVESGFLQTLGEASDEALARGSRVGRAIRGSRLSPLSPKFYPIERISAANQWAENWSRLSVYANMVKKGYTAPEAAAIARKYLLDYGDLAPANDAMRMVNPFITWTYKSAPLILGEMARDPKKIQIPMTILRAFGEEGEDSEGNPVMPQWMRESGAVMIPKGIREKIPGSFGDSPQAFLPDLPMYSTAETLRPLIPALEVLQGRPGAEQRLGREAWNLLGLGGVPGGLVKSTVEAASGQQLFSGRTFEPGQRVPTPAGLDKAFGQTMPWEQWNAISNLLPVASRLAILAPRSEYDKESQMRRAGSTLAGFTLFPVSEAQRRSEMYRRLDQLAALTRSLRDRGVKVPSRSRTSSSSGGGGTRPSSGKGFG